MKRRTRIDYAPEQKAIIRDRYKQGDSLHDIARMFDRYHSSIMPTIHQTGGYRPPCPKAAQNLGQQDHNGYISAHQTSTGIAC